MLFTWLLPEPYTVDEAPICSVTDEFGGGAGRSTSVAQSDTRGRAEDDADVVAEVGCTVVTGFAAILVVTVDFGACVPRAALATLVLTFALEFLARPPETETLVTEREEAQIGGCSPTVLFGAAEQ